jgi:hypothetical protein
MSSGCKSQSAREPAPPYRSEGEHALWHVSEDASLDVLEPHRARTAVSDDLLVWAVDTRHLPLFWFPRACPRATFWAAGTTRDEDVERFLDGRRDRRVHAIEGAGLAACGPHPFSRIGSSRAARSRLRRPRSCSTTCAGRRRPRECVRRAPRPAVASRCREPWSGRRRRRGPDHQAARGDPPWRPWRAQGPTGFEDRHAQQVRLRQPESLFSSRV